MSVENGELIFYGIGDISEKLDGIIKLLNFKKTIF